MAVLSLTNQPPGVRFSPTDVELIVDYLRKKITGNDEELIGFIPEDNFFKREPWEWPDFSGIESKDLEWFFFSPPDLKNRNSNRLNRATNAGYWKVTGQDLEIWFGESLIGIKKFLVFHEGRTPNGQKTDWVMHEYHATNPGQKSFVLCRLFKRPSQGSNGRKRKQSGNVGPAKSKRTQASSSASPASMQAEDFPTIDGNTSDSIAPVECRDNNFNIVSSPNTAKSSPEEAKSDLTPASVSPVSVQAEDYPTIDGTTSDTRAPVECGDNNFDASAAENPVADTEFDLQLEEELQMLLNTPAVSSESSIEEVESEQASVEEGDNHDTKCYHISDNADTTKNQVAEATAGKVEVDSNMSCPSPDLLDLDWRLLYTLLLPMQNGMKDPNSPDEFSYNDDPSSQKNVAFDCETVENMESVKDDGSRGAANAEMLNALKFDPTFQESMWSQEIYGRASSGMLNPGSNNCGSSLL